MSFANKVVIVTGASSGIGAATAIHFSREGAKVAMVGRNETKLKNVSEKCAQVGEQPLVIKADVSKDDDAKRIIKETVAKFGKIDVLVNNAGMGRLGSIKEGNVLNAYDQTMNTNLRAVIHLTTLATPHLTETKGNIVNVSSVAAQSVPANFPQFIMYFVSKAALDHFSRCAALELSSSGIRVNVVSPGPVKTDFIDNAKDEFGPIFGENVSFDDFASTTPLKRIGESEEIADLIVFLADNEKSKSITGSIFVSDNGTLLHNKV